MLRLALLVWLSFAAAQEKPAPKLPPPDAADQKSAERLVREIFKDEYAKKGAADRIALAKKLIDQALQTKDDPVTVFVLLRESRDIAAQIPDAALTIRAIDEMAVRFTIDIGGMKLGVLTAAVKAAKSPEEFGILARSYEKLAEDSGTAEDYDVAAKALEQASSLAKRSKDVALTSRIDLKSKRTAEVREKGERARKARETLIEKPNDEAACLAVGQFDCFIRGKWDTGLPLLARGADPALKSLAAKDLADPKEPAGQVVIGDAWWDLGDKESGTARSTLHLRALHWYQRALATLDGGLQKAKIEKRISMIQAERAIGGGWIDLSDPSFYEASDKPVESLVLQRGGVNLKKLPPGDYDGLTVRVKTLTRDATPNIQHAPLKEMVCLDVDDKSIAVQHYTAAAGWRVGKKAPLPPGDDYVITVSLDKGTLVVVLNGVEVLRSKSDVDRLLPIRLSSPGGKTAFSEVCVHKKE